MKKIYLFITVLLIIIIGLSIFFVKANVKKPDVVAEDTKTNSIEVDDSYDISTYVTDKIKSKAEGITSMAELSVAYTPAYLNKTADNIAVVRIISLEGATTEYNSMVGMTYGKLLINNSFAGSLKEGSVVDYIKPGGIVTVADYDAHEPKEAVEKRDYLRAQAGITIDKENEYYELKMEGDIDIEAGKTYLAYLKYCDDIGKYEIIGLENGLREVNIAKEDKSISKITLDLSKLQIKNNDTQQFESLNDYITKNITNNTTKINNSVTNDLISSKQ